MDKEVWVLLLYAFADLLLSWKAAQYSEAVLCHLAVDVSFEIRPFLFDYLNYCIESLIEACFKLYSRVRAVHYLSKDAYNLISGIGRDILNDQVFGAAHH